MNVSQFVDLAGVFSFKCKISRYLNILCLIFLLVRVKLIKFDVIFCAEKSKYPQEELGGTGRFSVTGAISVRSVMYFSYAQKKIVGPFNVQFGWSVKNGTRKKI